LEEAGGAVVVLEKDCTPEKMYELVKELLADCERRQAMTKALHGLVKTDSAERICDMVEELAKS
jgi:UDP-N-acetylglucosamine--N-acetylmuramyl-(pentapeptide) pyrophosphoryl-undecaprenol N-acetylglucosamine transferase